MQSTKAIEKGKRRTFWLPNKLDEKAEETRHKLGLARSGFYRFAVISIIKEFSHAHLPLASKKTKKQKEVATTYRTKNLRWLESQD